MSETGSYTTTDKDAHRPGTQGGEGAFLPAEDDPFKGAFVAASDDDDAPSDFNGSFVVGEPDENEDADKKKKREAAIKAFNEDAEKNKDKDNKDTRDHKDDWFSVSHRGRRQPATTVRHMTKDQLREIILKAILEKGWTEIWIYNGYNKEINQTLTKQAEEMIGEMMQPGGVLHGVIDQPPVLHKTRMSSQKDPKTGKMKVEPWAKGPFQSIHELDMRIRNWNNKRKAKKSSKKVDDAHRKLAKKKGYGDKIGKDPKTLEREAKEAERKAKRAEKDKAREEKKSGSEEKSRGRRHGGSDEGGKPDSELTEQFGKADQSRPKRSPRSAADETAGESVGEAMGETAGENMGAGGKSGAKRPKI